jgi:hypothetical protein
VDQLSCAAQVAEARAEDAEACAANAVRQCAVEQNCLSFGNKFNPESGI